MIRIRTSPGRWRYSIGIITSTTLIAQLLTNGDISPSIEPIEGMGEIKAELRRRAETIELQQREIDEKQAKVSELEKEVERLSEVRASRNSRRDTDRLSGGNISGESVLNVEATFYTAFCSTGCIGITATGLDVSSTIYTPEGLRVIAVDPNVIALGSKVRVTLANGDSFVAKAEDTGGDIKGARIDVLVSDRATAYSLGRQAATVEVISE